MYKQITINNGEGLSLSYPADSKTVFRLDGVNDYYTIIDVASVKNRIYALLESNSAGEDDTVLVWLGFGDRENDPMVLSRVHGTPFNVELTEPVKRVIFINQNKMIAQGYGNRIDDILRDEYPVLENEDIIVWDQEDIEKRKEGGLII